MADDTDGNHDSPLPTEDNSSADEESASQSDDDDHVEWLATGRQKRSTAGNRLTSLLQQEEPDDELELLFAEDDDDGGFEDVEAAQSDVQMDSSDDDDDQGPTAGADDLEGEKELERQSKAERHAKKRKLNDGIPKIFKKRVKIDPTAADGPAPPRPKKKSERMSWIPSAEEAPTRASARGTTQQSKQQLHAQMVDREIKRIKQMANMEKTAAAKEAAKKPAMTQEDRLAEAARIEKSNSKSLSRWEEAEQQREEEQRAKLAALSNRQLEGPVITWWSGLAEWVGGRLRRVGKTLTIEEPKEKPRKRKAAEMEAEPKTNDAVSTIPVTGASSAEPDQTMTDAPTQAPASGMKGETAQAPASETAAATTLALVTETTAATAQAPATGTAAVSIEAPAPETAPASVSDSSPDPAPATASEIVPEVAPETAPPTAPSEDSATPLPPTSPPRPTAILATTSDPTVAPLEASVTPAASTPPLVAATASTQTPAPAHAASQPDISFSPSHASPPKDNAAPRIELPQLPQLPTLPKPTDPLNPPFILAPPRRLYLDGSAPLPGFTYSVTPPSQPSQTIPFVYAPAAAPNLPAGPPPPPAIEHATRNYLILSNFDETAVKSKDVQTQILFGRKFVKAHKPKVPELCAITSYTAKFRDPSSGLPYCNAYAYNQIQKLKRGEYKWSKLVGAYVGQGTYAARGVPSRFMSANATKD